MSGQGTYEWYKARYGKITGSQRITGLMNGNPHTLNRMLKAMWSERDHGDSVIEADFEKARALNVDALNWGKAHEPEAVAAYVMRMNADVQHAPVFTPHPDYADICGISIDFLDDTNSFVGEIKCPLKGQNHIATLAHGMPAQHVNQTQLGLAVFGDAAATAFVSYDPRHPVIKDRLYVERVERDQSWQTRFASAIAEFADHFRNGTLYRLEGIQLSDGVPELF